MTALHKEPLCRDISFLLLSGVSRVALEGPEGSRAGENNVGTREKGKRNMLSCLRCFFSDILYFFNRPFHVSTSSVRSDGLRRTFCSPSHARGTFPQAGWAQRARIWSMHWRIMLAIAWIHYRITNYVGKNSCPICIFYQSAVSYCRIYTPWNWQTFLFIYLFVLYVLKKKQTRQLF